MSIPIGAADAVLFAIQAGVRLYGQARQAYVENTRARDIVLPMPGLDHAPTVEMATLYFSANAQGRAHVRDDPRLGALFQQAVDDALADAARADYLELFALHRAMDAGLRTEDHLLRADVLALNTIAQWRRGDTPHPTALRRIAGTLAEIGIDFFANGPGASAVTGNAPAKRLLRDLLVELDDQSFVAIGLDGAIERIFVATLDAIARDPALVSDDERVRRLTASVAGGLVADVNARLEALPEDRRLFAADRLGETAALLFKGVLRHAGGTVLQNPDLFLRIDDDGRRALVGTVGTVLLDTLASSEGNGLARLFTAETLDRLVKSTLSVVAEHPELLLGDRQQGLRRILQEVAGGIAAETDRLGPDLLPEIAALVLDRTAEHLPLVWNGGGAGEHLLVTGAQALLRGLSQPGPAGRTFRLALGKTQLLAVVDALLDDVAANPRLVTVRLSDVPALQAAVEAAVGTLASRGAGRLSPDTMAAILRSAISAATRRMEFLQAPADGVAATVLAEALDAILAVALDQTDARAAWALAEAHVVQGLVEISLGALAEHGASAAALAALREALDATVVELRDRGRLSLDRFHDDLEDRLAA